MTFSRREIIAAATASMVALATGQGLAQSSSARARIGLTSVALRSRFPQHTPDGTAADLDLLQWPAFVRDTFDLQWAELWSQHFDRTSFHYCEAIRKSAEDAGVKIINIQMDGKAGEADPTDLSAEDLSERLMWVDQIKRWMDRSRLVGAPFLRANTDKHVEGRPFDLDRVVDSYRRLADYGAEIGVTILVENHGGYSRDLKKVAAIVEAVDHPYCRALADWGNSAGDTTSERIESLAPIMPTALISAKGKTFDESTWAHLDYDVTAMTRAAERAGFEGVYSVELYAIPAPSDPVAAVRSMIASIEDGITRGM